MALPIPSWNDFRKMVDYWKKFKGKKARIWFSRAVINFCTYCYGDSVRARYSPFREIGASPTVDGVISDVIDNPFGIMLKDVSLWNERTKTVSKVETEIKEIFIPMSEISRIDFL